MNKKGFTLIELIIVITILAILATIGIKMWMTGFNGITSNYISPKYKISVYNGGKLIKEYVTSYYYTGEDGVTFYIDEQRYMIHDNYTVEPINE